MAKYDSNRTTITIDKDWLPSLDGKPPTSDRSQADYLLELYRRDIPRGWSSNRHVQSQQYQGTQYVAIRATWSWLAGSSVIVEREKTVDEMAETDGDEYDSPPRKARRIIRKANTPGGLGNDDRYHPVEPSHPASKLFEYINPVDTFQDFIAQWTIQQFLTGNVHVWTPKNGEGRPAELWVLPSVVITPVVPGISANYPCGGYRINPALNLGWGAFGIPAIGNVILDARDVLRYRDPHAFLRSDGYGATEAMRRQIDILNGVETTRGSAMAKGINGGGLLVFLEGATAEQCSDFKRDLVKNNGGPDRAGEPTVVGTENGAAVPSMMTPTEMAFESGWEQSTRSVLAGYRVPPVVAGLIEANYAEFWAAVRAWYAGELKPSATRISAFLTKHLAEPYWPGHRIRLQLPPIEDQEAIIAAHSFVPNDLFTMDEHRAAFDLPPMEGGEGNVPPSQYAAANMVKMGFDATGRKPNTPDPESDRPEAGGKGALPGKVKSRLPTDMASVVDEILGAV